MTQLGPLDKQHQGAYQLLLGLGKTGFACARFLQQTRPEVPLIIADSDTNPPCYQALQAQYPNTPVYLGELSAALCRGAERIIVSPGVNVAQPAIHKAARAGVPIISDIDLFTAEAKAPIVAITGTNGKSTVTGWVFDMAKKAGLSAAIGGNFGIPAVDLLDDAIQLYVLELSSFQLETTHNLGVQVACLLNITPDHIDRHGDFAAYCQAKYKIFDQCQCAITNQDADVTQPQVLIDSLLQAGIAHHAFTLSVPHQQQYGLCQVNDEEWICYGTSPLLRSKEVSLLGRHNLSNALAAVTIGTALELPVPAMLSSLRNYVGLEHRGEHVLSHAGVTYINDSKGTNAAAAAAAIESFGRMCAGKILFIAGGDAKGADFSELLTPTHNHVKTLFAYGKDGGILANTLEPVCETVVTHDLNMAVQQAYEQAQSGDLVLLSPACSSLDQFIDFNHRGATFKATVKALTETGGVLSATQSKLQPSAQSLVGG